MLIRLLIAAPATAPPVALGRMRFLPPLLGEVPEGRWGRDPVQRSLWGSVAVVDTARRISDGLSGTRRSPCAAPPSSLS